MSTVAGNNQQVREKYPYLKYANVEIKLKGIYMENGSGGFMSDLTFSGGAIGAYLGNQQFSVRNLSFSQHQQYAIEIHWDWGWTFKGITVNACSTAVFMSTPGSFTQVGSAIFIDSVFTNCFVGFSLQTGAPNATISLSLFSVTTTNVLSIVEYVGEPSIFEGSGGTTFIGAWGIGKRYDTNAGEASGVWQNGAYPTTPNISPSLLVGTTNILWIPAGVYLVTSTVFIPSNTTVVGQSWSQIMGFGPNFQDANAPYPVIQVGNIGDVGDVEIQDLLFTIRGPAPGAIILLWNIHEASQGSAAMWGNYEIHSNSLFCTATNMLFHSRHTYSSGRSVRVQSPTCQLSQTFRHCQS
jgi:hypothetical protein